MFGVHRAQPQYLTGRILHEVYSVPFKRRCSLLAGKSGRGGGGAYSFVACLSHLTIDHASLPRRIIVPTPNRDTSNVWAFITFFHTGRGRGGVRNHSRLFLYFFLAGLSAIGSALHVKRVRVYTLGAVRTTAERRSRRRKGGGGGIILLSFVAFGFQDSESLIMAS